MSVETCYQHPDRLAVEHCEVCRRPVCGSCLWYAETGERLCPDHAADWLKEGKTVSPPERYADGISHSQASAARPVLPSVPYRGNSTDVTALLAAAGGVLSVAACFGLSWIIPLLAFGMGLLGWLQSKDALDPKRTRWLSGIGMAGAGLMLVGFMLFIFACMIFPIFMALITSSRPIVPTPSPLITPLPFVIPTP